MYQFFEDVHSLTVVLDKFRCGGICDRGHAAQLRGLLVLHGRLHQWLHVRRSWLWCVP